MFYFKAFAFLINCKGYIFYYYLSKNYTIIKLLFVKKLYYNKFIVE